MIYISTWHASQLQAIYSNLVTSHSQLQSCILLTFRLDNLRFMINKWDCCRLNGDKIMKHTGLALHNTHCCSSAWQPQLRETDRLSEAACCLNFWLQPSATLLVSFIINDSVNPTRLSLWGLRVWARVCMCVFSSAWGKQRNGDRSEPIQCGWVSCVCPWPFSAFTNGTACAAGIKMLCKVGTLALTEKLFPHFSYKSPQKSPDEIHDVKLAQTFQIWENTFFFLAWLVRFSSPSSLVAMGRKIIF